MHRSDRNQHSNRIVVLEKYSSIPYCAYDVISSSCCYDDNYIIPKGGK